MNRAAALVAAAHARDADDLRLLLDALGMLPAALPTVGHPGRVGSYRAGCRCDGCRAAVLASTRRTLARARERLADPEQRARYEHGRIYTYRAGCRCADCRAVSAKSRAEERRRRAARERGAA
jgi:hypothetical protein